MIAAVIKFLCLVIVLPLVFTTQSAAQICINKYSAIKLEGSTYDIFTKSIVTPGGEVISAGKLFDYNSAGHIAKFSEKGALIWSYRYNLDFYDFIKQIFFKAVNISDVINTADGGIVVAGNVEQVLSPWGNPPPVKKWGLMAKMDKFGKVLWTKTFTNSNNNGELNFSDIHLTADGDYIAYLATDNGVKVFAGDHTYGKVLRIAPDGRIKWSTFLFTYMFDAGGIGLENKRAVTQAANGNIVIGDVVHKTLPLGEIKEGNLHFFELDYTTGKLNWETSYEYPVPANDTVYRPDIVNVKELPGGKFSFITTLYLPSDDGNVLIKKGANIITNNRGVIENVIAYVPADRSACTIKDAAVDNNNGTRTLLVNVAGNSMLLHIDNNGQAAWQQGYNDQHDNLPVNCFSAGKNGYNIFLSNNRSFQYRLFITDTEGGIDCANTPAGIIPVPAELNYSHDSVVTNPDYYSDPYEDYAHPLKRGEEYPLLANIECQETLACCTDFIDKENITNINICEGRSYMLPDSTVIQDSGLYYVTFKTALGCDSIRYYQVKLDKDVASLTLGSDTCLTTNTTIKLKATEGFEKYYWMNSLLPGSADFTVLEEGNYYVRVNNVCGSKTDSIEIFDVCDYPVYLPNAFSPNGDNINDFFRVPPANKNKLTGLRIYNRWGKLIFQTNNPSEGWDGTFKNEPLGTDTFIYFIEMTGLSGKKVSQKGYVTLIR